MIYFTADLHLGHEAILYMAERPYKNLDEMNQTLIRNINAFVTDRDTLYILGDIAHKLEVPDAEEWIRQIHGKKILIRGNHDKEYDPSLFEEICDYKEITVDEQRFILMHYPLRAWHKMRGGASSCMATSTAVLPIMKRIVRRASISMMSESMRMITIPFPSDRSSGISGMFL